MKDEWNKGYEKGRDDYCCNHNCNQGRDCPLRKAEPVAWRKVVGNVTKHYQYNEIGEGTALYTHPVKELTLTDDEVEEFEWVLKKHFNFPTSEKVPNLDRIIRAILRKASEK